VIFSRLVSYVCRLCITLCNSHFIKCLTLLQQLQPRTYFKCSAFLYLTSRFVWFCYVNITTLEVTLSGTKAIMVTSRIDFQEKRLSQTKAGMAMSSGRKSRNRNPAQEREPAIIN
jgi:hypothetical protein